MSSEEGANNDAPTPPASRPGLVEAARALWRKLSARKVVQWSAAYVVLAFGLLQGVSFVRSMFDLPASVDRIALVLLLSGLAIVVTLAWHHGDLGRQRVTRVEGGLVAAFAAAGVALAAIVAQSPNAPTAQQTSNLPRLAVLRFESLGDTEPYFAEGVADELISEASRIRGLDVSARASSFGLTGEHATPANAAHVLGATLVLTGSIRRLPDHVRVQAQLVEAPGGRQLWDQTFERPTDEIYGLQRDIAVQVARAAGLRAQPAAARRVAPDALQLYLRARELQLQRMRAGTLSQARDDLRQAVTIDPTFAEAWAWLSYVELQLVDDGGQAPNAASYAPALEAARRARSLKPEITIAYEVLSAAPAVQGQWMAAREAGLEAEARGDFAFNWRVGTGSLNALIATMRRQVTLNPQNENLWAYFGSACLYAGDNAGAMDAERRALDLNPNHPAAVWLLFEAVRRSGDRAAARRLLTQYSGAWRAAGIVSAEDRHHLLVLLGEGRPFSKAELLALQQRGDLPMGDVIWELTATGQIDDAASLLPNWGGDFNLESLYDAPLAPLRARPEFWALMQRKGLVAYWRQTREWPDFCERERQVCERYLR